MKYKNTVKGRFISRPNRFIAHVDIGGETHVCHVKNTGRCRELLTPNATVILEKADSESRKTAYDLIGVYKGNRLVNMDSQAPNKVFAEWAATTDFFGELVAIRPETTYKSSRFDFCLESTKRKIFVEVKGVTLEENGVVLFPDAPTERGVKHLTELIDAKKNGYDAYIFFVIQMENCSYFTPNISTHKEFANTLALAKNEGVKVCAVNCKVTESSLEIADFVEVKI